MQPKCPFKFRLQTVPLDTNVEAEKLDPKVMELYRPMDHTKKNPRSKEECQNRYQQKIDVHEIKHLSKPGYVTTIIHPQFAPLKM